MGALLDSDRLMRLVGAIHSGAADDSLWSDALDQLSDLMGGARILMGHAPDDFRTLDFSGHRVDPDLVALVNGPLASRKANPLFGAIPRAPHHTPVILTTRLPRKKFLRSEVYEMVLKPSGVRHVMAVILDSDAYGAHALAIGRGAAIGEFDGEASAFLAAFSPHIATAAATRKRLAGVTTGVDALEMLDRGVILCAADGTIAFANREAERILTARDGLESINRRVSPERSGEAARLRALVASAAAASAGRGTGVGGVMRVSRRSMRSEYIVHVAPAGRRASSEWKGVQSLAVMFIHDPAQTAPVPEQWLAAAYSLTRAEGALALRLYQGDGLTEAAECLGITANTAKTQLKSIFDKFDVSRQSQLVRAIALGFGGVAGMHSS
jgi:DNA-binding CsgD family transcriptional regulator